MLLSPRFRHVSFPRQAARRRLVDLAAADLATAGLRPAAAEREARLPHAERAFVDWLFAQLGLDASAYRTETLARRISACLRTLRVTTLTQAWRVLEAEPQRIASAASAMLIGATSFYRDPEVFDSLARDVLPALAAGRNGVYVWSAGCSAGEELYSVAMLLAESGLLRCSHLLGTDCRADAIAQAKAGLYHPAAASQMPSKLRDRYLAPEAALLRVAKELTRAARWRTANVLAEQETGYWDLILFRNTSIYLRASATRLLWEQLEASLRVGGALVLGKAERPVGAKRLAAWGPCVYRKVSR